MNWKDWATLDDITYAIRSHEAVVVSGLPNHLVCRIPVKSNLNIRHLRNVLEDYPDKDILYYLEFGFPTGALSSIPVNSPCSNHPA